MKKQCRIFVSYSEDSPEHVARIKQIVDRLEYEGFIVSFFEKVPFGTDMIQFMREIETCDIMLLVGSPQYKDKAYNSKSSGVSFEDRITADVFMSASREKIVPISFDGFEASIPAPFNKLKGMQLTVPTTEELDTLISGLIHRYKINPDKNRHNN